MSFLDGKTILITGGTGTFGHAFVLKTLRETRAKKIIILSRDEFKQSDMQREVPDPDERLRFFLGDVRDLARLERAFEDVDVVVHAAALKQVPALEYNPLEAVKTNVMGTQNVIDAALNNNVEKVLFVSSDKAVYPVNLYGATKLCAEKLIISANVYSGEKRHTKFSVVRYGNVLGSRGSLIELIGRQKPTGVVTLTDERMTRFWITVDNVMDVVHRALGVMRGGEIFVPRMKSLLVRDVINALAPDCRIHNIGIRPGEKLHEALISDHEADRTKIVGDVFVIQPDFGWFDGTWLADQTSLSSGLIYASNHPDYLLSAGDVARVLGPMNSKR